MKFIFVKDQEELAQTAADIIKRCCAQPTNLGLASGGTVAGAYAKLAGQDFRHVTTFNLDEYIASEPFMRKQMTSMLFAKTKFKRSFFPSDETYDDLIQRAGGIGLQVLGVGHNGHIGFNEPGPIFINKTNKVNLARETIDANARWFEHKPWTVPTQAWTAGIGTIMSAKKIILLAGKDKAHIIRKLQTQEIVDPLFPVSILHYHKDVTIIAETVDSNVTDLLQS